MSSLFRVICLLAFACFPLKRTYSYYLAWDNFRLATHDELFLDPLLIIRNKVSIDDLNTDIAKSWPLVSDVDSIFLDERFIDFSEVTNFGDISVEVDYQHIAVLFSNESLGKTFQWAICRDQKVILTGEMLTANIKPYQKIFIEIDSLMDTYIDPEFLYAFVVRVKQNGRWSNWSYPKTFVVNKPTSPKNLNFQRICGKNYLVKWDHHDIDSCNYYIFASNARDFLPSIYSDKQLDGFCHEKGLLWSDNINLIQVTQRPEVIVSQNYLYLRVIKEVDGVFSNPSELLYLYGNNSPTVPTFIQKSIADNTSFLRAPLYKDIFSSRSYKKHPYVSQAVWDSCQPYFLPENHKMKVALDRIFSKDIRVTQNFKTLKKAGFKHVKEQPYSKVIVATHNLLKDHLVKIYLDEEDSPLAWAKWKDRILGKEACKKCIFENGFGHIFVVPGKWIYPLPSEPSPPTNMQRKNFILVVEDMHLIDAVLNEKRWKSSSMSSYTLNAVYILLRDVGLADSVYVWNLPFTKHNKIAIIDTEYYHQWPVDYTKLSNFLSWKNRVYWKKLILNDGPYFDGAAPLPRNITESDSCNKQLDSVVNYF